MKRLPNNSVTSPGQGKPGPPCGLTTCRESHWGRVHCKPGGRQKYVDPRHRRLVQGTWNVTSLAGKEPELVQEVEWYQLDMVGLTSTHSTGSRTKLLERGWTLSFSRVAQGARCQAGVGILTIPRLSAAVLEFSPVNERVASMRLQVAGGKALSVVCVLTHQTAVQSIRPSWSPWWHPGKGSIRGLHSSTGELQRTCGQWWRNLERSDWDERPARSEPAWCFVIGLLCQSWTGHNKHHVRT